MLGGPERVENRLEGILDDIISSAKRVALEQNYTKWVENLFRLMDAKKALYDYIAEIEAKCT